MHGRRGCSDLGFWISDCGSWRAGALVSDLKPSWWDSNDAAMLLWAVGDARHGKSPEQRMALRIGAFEDAANGQAQFGGAKAECDRRIAHLLRTANGGGKGLRSSPVIPVGMIVLGAGLACSIVTQNAHPIVLAPALGFGIIGGLAFYARRARWLQKLKQGACLTCGYDLTKSLPGYEAKPEIVRVVGPRVCTECGAVWPLVPPAIEVGG